MVKFNSAKVDLEKISSFFGKRNGQRNIHRILAGIGISDYGEGNKTNAIKTVLGEYQNDSKMFIMVFNEIILYHSLKSSDIDYLNPYLESIGYNIQYKKNEYGSIMDIRVVSIEDKKALTEKSITKKMGKKRIPVEDKHPRPIVFISYVRENAKIVSNLRTALEDKEIGVWQDKDAIEPGKMWKAEIKKAISEGDFFVACFSDEYYKKDKTYMNEELTAAVEELRLRPTDSSWFIPVLLTDCKIPNREIGGGKTLRDIQGVELFVDWDDGLKRIVKTIHSNKSKNIKLKGKSEIIDSECPICGSNMIRNGTLCPDCGFEIISK